MKKYFKEISSLEELRSQYKILLKQFHPDNGGNVADMQEINAEYDKLFKVLKDRHESKTAENTSKQSDYNANMYDWENDKALREMLEKIINFDGIEIEIIGQWIWLDGNTYPHKDILKAIGFKWSKNHKKWHWHSGEFKRYGRKKFSYAEIQSKYGSTRVGTNTRVLLEA